MPLPSSERESPKTTIYANVRDCAPDSCSRDTFFGFAAMSATVRNAYTRVWTIIAPRDDLRGKQRKYFLDIIPPNHVTPLPLAARSSLFLIPKRKSCRWSANHQTDGSNNGENIYCGGPISLLAK